MNWYSRRWNDLSDAESNGSESELAGSHLRMHAGLDNVVYTNVKPAQAKTIKIQRQQ
jgi:hypothetical protein